MNRRDFLKNTTILSAGIIIGIPTFKTKVEYWTINRPAEIITFKSNDGQIFEKGIYVCTYRIKSFDDFLLENKDRNIFVYQSGSYGVNEYYIQMNWLRAVTLPKEWTPINLNKDIKLISYEI